MEGKNQHLAIRGCISQWILICFILPHSEAVCYVPNCNLSECNGYACNSCNGGYHLLYGSSCIPCQQSLPGCATCSSSTSCTKCKDGYYLQSESCIQCQLYIPRCMTCSSSTSCTKCTDGYYLQSGYCIKYCPCLNDDLYEDLNSCQQQMKTCREIEDQYQLTFGHGLATGIGISIVLFGSGVGIALFIKRRTKLNKHENKASDETNVYVNTNMSNILSVIASESNDVTDDIPTVSSDSTNTEVTNIDSSKDYVSLGDRQTNESKYSDLQNT